MVAEPQLSDERKADVARALSSFFNDEFDEDLSDFRALEVVDFLLGQIGPSQYNQAIIDARAYFLEKVEDLDSVLYVPEKL
jgi:uncharacterized protein (DUF2164 family)